MYESHFRLRHRPFQSTPDSACYYPATSHEQALAQLLQALDDEEGLILLTGAPGTGKTLLAHCLLERLGDDLASAFLTNSHFRDRAGLLQAILYDLSLPYERQTEQELRLALTEYLLTNYGAGRRTLIVVDEAQHLSLDLLEELRLLGNLEGRQGKAVQVALLAQPGFRELLSTPELAAFQQRLGAQACLEPLGVHEAADYLVHHLRAAGGRPEQIITDEALEILARATRGLPRLLNRAAHQALIWACNAGIGQVEAETALEALNALGLADDESAAGTPEASFCSSQEAVGMGALEESEDRARAAEPVLTLDPQGECAETVRPEEISSKGSARDPSRLRRLFAPPRQSA